MTAPVGAVLLARWCCCRRGVIDDGARALAMVTVKSHKYWDLPEQKSGYGTDIVRR
jgi:hypothetical protein